MFNPEDYSTIKAVECMVCKKLHRMTSEDYYTFYGNVTLGGSGGIIGNNFGPDGKLERVQHVCASPKCLQDIFKKGFNFPTTRELLEHI